MVHVLWTGSNNKIGIQVNNYTAWRLFSYHDDFSKSTFKPQLNIIFNWLVVLVNDSYLLINNNFLIDNDFCMYFQSTAVLTYRPSSQDKLLSCSLQSIEVFSCSLLSEEETALSIIDPLMINVDLNANPLPDLSKSLSTGLLEASEIRQKNLVLEVCVCV
jgi:hypothetical protein